LGTSMTTFSPGASLISASYTACVVAERSLGSFAILILEAVSLKPLCVIFSAKMRLGHRDSLSILPDGMPSGFTDIAAGSMRKKAASGQSSTFYSVYTLPPYLSRRSESSLRTGRRALDPPFHLYCEIRKICVIPEFSEMPDHNLQAPTRAASEHLRGSYWMHLRNPGRSCARLPRVRPVRMREASTEKSSVGLVL
jgi:hypothetical protein